MEIKPLLIVKIKDEDINNIYIAKIKEILEKGYGEQFTLLIFYKHEVGAFFDISTQIITMQP